MTITIRARKLIMTLALVLSFGFLLGPAFMHHSANNSGNLDPNLFKGKITNLNVYQGSFSGKGVYDRNCVPVEGGLTNCDAGIKIEGRGTLNFNYTHNMMEQPCLQPGQELSLKITDNTGSAIVRRL